MSQFLLSVPVMWEDKPLKIFVSGATYMSMQEAVFLWLPLSTLQERRQFLQLSACFTLIVKRAGNQLFAILLVCASVHCQICLAVQCNEACIYCTVILSMAEFISLSEFDLMSRCKCLESWSL